MDRRFGTWNEDIKHIKKVQISPLWVLASWLVTIIGVALCFYMIGCGALAWLKIY